MPRARVSMIRATTSPSGTRRSSRVPAFAARSSHDPRCGRAERHGVGHEVDPAVVAGRGPDGPGAADHEPTHRVADEAQLGDLDRPGVDQRLEQVGELGPVASRRRGRCRTAAAPVSTRARRPRPAGRRRRRPRPARSVVEAGRLDHLLDLVGEGLDRCTTVSGGRVPRPVRLGQPVQEHRDARTGVRERRGEAGGGRRDVAVGDPDPTGRSSAGWSAANRSPTMPWRIAWA